MTPDRMELIDRAARWLACVDNPKQRYERDDPQTRLIRQMLKELQESR